MASTKILIEEIGGSLDYLRGHCHVEAFYFEIRETRGEQFQWLSSLV
jgi:hypothetical protein